MAAANLAWPANDPVLQDLLAVRRETADPARLRRVARLRRRGQDDRHRRRRSPSSSTGSPRPRSGPSRRLAVLLERKRQD